MERKCEIIELDANDSRGVISIDTVEQIKENFAEALWKKENLDQELIFKCSDEIFDYDLLRQTNKKYVEQTGLIANPTMSQRNCSGVMERSSSEFFWDIWIEFEIDVFAYDVQSRVIYQRF